MREHPRPASPPSGLRLFKSDFDPMPIAPRGVPDYLFDFGLSTSAEHDGNAHKIEVGA